MISILFDANIYAILSKNRATCESINLLASSARIRVFVSRTVAEELYRSPFRGVPNLFPVEYVGNTVGRMGIMCCGDSLGSGDVFYEHLGKSVKANDALIADAASWHADWLAFEDERLRKRAGKTTMRAHSMNYAEFKAKIQFLLSTPLDGV